MKNARSRVQLLSYRGTALAVQSSRPSAEDKEARYNGGRAVERGPLLHLRVKRPGANELGVFFLFGKRVPIRVRVRIRVLVGWWNDLFFTNFWSETFLESFCILGGMF